MGTMKMTFRWFGSDNDSVTLGQIRQIPAMSGVVGALYDTPVGEAWSPESVKALVDEVHAAGLELEVIESVNIHEDIKLGLPSRDRYIANYIQTLRVLAAAGVKVVCYNFMPIFDWFRTDLAWRLPDGSSALYFGVEEQKSLTAQAVVKKIAGESGGFILPGWEPDRLAKLEELFAAYEGVTEDDLRAHLKYFLDAVIPVCEEVGLSMGIHPDDPPWNIFGLPRIVKDRDSIDSLLALNSSPRHGLTFCSGSLGANRNNDLPTLARRWSGRIPFAHLRNIRFLPNGDFHESAHPTQDGSLDMFAIVEALVETGFTGYVRPDHGRMIWDEKARPGYGLYDRALGAAYLTGLFEAVERKRA
jgi:mannonate dehydratase